MRNANHVMKKLFNNIATVEFAAAKQNIMPPGKEHLKIVNFPSRCCILIENTQQTHSKHRA